MISRYEHNISFAAWIAISMYKELSFRLNSQMFYFKRILDSKLDIISDLQLFFST